MAGKEGIDITQALVREEAALLKKSKKTLIMLRRECKNKLELRHQRNCDVCFHFVQPKQQKLYAGAPSVCDSRYL